MAISANRTELLQIADAVARDKSIDKSVVLHAMEDAMQRAGKAVGERMSINHQHAHPSFPLRRFMLASPPKTRGGNHARCRVYRRSRA